MWWFKMVGVYYVLEIYFNTATLLRPKGPGSGFSSEASLLEVLERLDSHRLGGKQSDLPEGRCKEVLEHRIPNVHREIIIDKEHEQLSR